MAITAANDTPGLEFTDFEYKVKGSTTIYQGTLVVTSDGYAKSGVKATGLKILGIAKTTVVNAGADGAEVIVCAGPVAQNGKRLLFKLANDATDPVTQAHVGGPCYVFDNFTVTSLATGSTQCGTVRRVDSDGVWFELVS